MTSEQAAQDLLEILHNMLYTNSFGGFQCTRDDAGDIEAAIDALGKALAQPVTQDIPQIPQQRSSNEQEPVGWFGYDTGLRLWFEANKGDDDAIPLYKLKEKNNG